MQRYEVTYRLGSCSYVKTVQAPDKRDAEVLAVREVRRAHSWAGDVQIVHVQEVA